MKNSNQKKYFGITSLIIALFLSITSCDKDETIIEFEQSEITLDKTKEIFNSSFNKDAFPNLKNEPLWESAKTYFVNDKQYIEIPFTDISKINLKKSTSVSIDKLLAFISPDGKPTLNVVHYYAQDIQTHFPNFDEILYFDLTDFNGFATLYNLNKNVINSNKYSSGVKSDYEYVVKSKKENDNNNNLFYRMPEDCEMHTETIITESCWFWIYNDGSIEIIDCYYDYEYVTYETCDSQGGGGGGGTTVVTEENELEEFEIITINLDDCSKAIFDSIKSSNPMEKIILQFSGDNTPFNWTLETADESTFENTSNSAETNWLNGTANNYITKIGTNYKNSATKLSIARTIVHESIHAYILSYLDLDTNSFAKEFPELWNDMVAKKYGVPNNNLEQYQHEEMARNYVSTISSALAEWDNNQQSTQYYQDIAWGGLFETDAFQQSSDLSNTDRIRISNVNNAEDSNSSNSKSNPCN